MNVVQASYIGDFAEYRANKAKHFGKCKHEIPAILNADFRRISKSE
uniref:Uncharacterized protein n=1 Tax=Myoviridae sp. ctwVB15 TaxID=2825208 RepID=A0A8S5UNG9_9CAUD|nr:MAG TPA: hypothetical protein [Myoviridae sp. ctwVB15]